MQYFSTEPELFYTSNRGHEMWGICSYSEKNTPMKMMELWRVFDYLKLFPSEICEFEDLYWEKVEEKEEWVRASIEKVIPDWKRDY